MAQTTSQGSKPKTTTTEPEEELADLPGFAQTAPPRSPDLLDPEVTMTSTSSEWSPGDDDVSWDDDAAGDLPPVSAGAATASSKASIDWQDLVPLTSTLVAMSSLLVRWVRARRREVPLPEGVWVADEEDAEAIAAPLARIAARRSPVGGKGSADMVDGLEVLVGTTGYAMKNLEREAQSANWPSDEPPPV